MSIPSLKKFLKEKLPLIIICFVIVASCWYLTFRHYIHFGYQSDLITTLETKILDYKFITRGPMKPKSKIAILAIDEKTLEQFGRWPISRRHYEKALHNLKNIGVKWVGFDAVFSEEETATLKDASNLLDDLLLNYSTKSPQDLQASAQEINAMGKNAPGDQIFAKGISEFENVILGYFYMQSKSEVKRSGRSNIAFKGLDQMQVSAIEALVIPDGKELENYHDGLKAYGIVANTSLLTNAAKNFAFFSNQADNDAIVRWVTLVQIINGKLMPSLSLKIAAEMMGRDILVTFDDHGVEDIELVSRENGSDVLQIPTDPMGLGRLLANHRGPSLSFQHFSLADAYNNSFDESQKEFLKGASLLTGMTATGINDQRPNPFDPVLDGVENHATAADNIISGDFLKRPRSIYNIELIILIAIGLIFSPILISSRASFAAISVSAFIIAYYYFDKYYWFNRGIWAYMGMPMIEIILLFITITLYKYIVEEREKRKVKGAFSHYLSPEVINQVLENPESLQLGGVRKELTVFFSDVRSFTTISESLTPEKLCEFMNQYFTPMTSIILKSKGVLDKYIGDAIMAFWGAPIPLLDQADIACDAAIEMLIVLDQLQKDFAQKGFPRCDIGIGLNTGPMSVGNMGSDERFCYTVMGDAVNLGSRLEGLTKEYGIKLIVSESTIAKLTKKHHLYRDLDDIRVKGKNEPVKVFHLLRPDILTPQQSQDLIGMFQRGREAYRAQDWLKSKNCFKECLLIQKGDGPSMTYLSRIEHFINSEKIPDWDGVYTFTHK